jgi:soluble lytic murein transglycosylase-like protein
MNRKFTKIMIALLALAAIPALGADLAVLRNGFSISHERHEVIGAVTRLYLHTGDTGYVDVPSDQIDHFEKDLTPVSAPATTAPQQPSSFAARVGLPQPRPSLNEVVSQASDRYRLDPDLVSSVIHAESGFNPRAVSPKGAQGLMQLMPQTASKLGVSNAFDPQANVDGGTQYLRNLLEQYHFDLVKALAAYNAGPQRVAQYGGVPPYFETQAYVARIVREFNRKKLEQQKNAQVQAAKAHAASKSASSGGSSLARVITNPSRPTQRSTQ